MPTAPVTARPCCSHSEATSTVAAGGAEASDKDASKAVAQSEAGASVNSA